MDKEQIRTGHRDRRRELSKETVEQESHHLCERLARELSLDEFNTILFYYPSPGEGEVDLRLLFQISFEELSEARCLLPRVYPDQNRIQSHVIPDNHAREGEELKSYYSLERSEIPLEPGMYGIPEPCPDQCPLLEPDCLDLVFVPGLAFDYDGFRVGYGGGYYDRLLGELSEEAVTVGICYDWQLIDECPRESHDRAVDTIVTNRKRVHCQ